LGERPSSCPRSRCCRHVDRWEEYSPVMTPKNWTGAIVNVQ
jgi:hypothetical protein